MLTHALLVLHLSTTNMSIIRALVPVQLVGMFPQLKMERIFVLNASLLAQLAMVQTQTAHLAMPHQAFLSSLTRVV